MADLIGFNRCQQSARFFETSHNVRKRTAEKYGSVPRKEIILPPNRADWSFGELVYWHFYVYGTRPKGNPKAKKGRVWTRKELFQARDVSDKTLSNWISGKTLPDSTAKAEKALFGNSLLFDDWRIELAEKLSESRARKAEEAARAQADAPPVVREFSDDADASTSEDADEISDLEATGKVRKSETENPEIQDNSTELSSDPQGQSGDASDTEDIGNFRKSAHDSSEEAEPLPEDHPPGEKDDTTQGHEDEPARPSSQSGREEPEHDDVKGQGAVPDLYSSPYRYKVKPRRLVALVATAAVVVFGLYAATLTHRFSSRQPATPSAPSTSAGQSQAPGPQASLPSTPQSPSKHDQPQPSPNVTAAQSKPAVPPQSKQPKPTVEEQALIDARRAAQAEEVRQRIAKAIQLDQEGAAGAKARAQRERERNANEVAGLGYRLFEYASVRGTSLGQVQTETVYDCAKSCHDIGCDAFAWYRDERPGGPRTCSRYKAPFTLEENTGYTAGKKVSGILRGVKLTVAGGTAQVVQLLAQASPSSIELDADGVVHCPNGPVKVTGFDLTCDAMLVGGTTLGSHRLSWTVKNINECARKCQPIKNCVGFTYNAAQQGGHSCVLFGATPEKREDVPGWISGARPAQ